MENKIKRNVRLGDFVYVVDPEDYTVNRVRVTWLATKAFEPGSIGVDMLGIERVLSPEMYELEQSAAYELASKIISSKMNGLERELVRLAELHYRYKNCTKSISLGTY